MGKKVSNSNNKVLSDILEAVSKLSSTLDLDKILNIALDLATSMIDAEASSA